MIDLTILQTSLITLAHTAAERILDLYGHDHALDIHRKPDYSPVTTADLAAHTIITQGLQQLTPTLPILSEEDARHAHWETRKNWQTYWLIDPLDGTRSFITNVAEFTVNIALIHNHTPILGCIVTPITHECYFASHKQGAYKITQTSDVQRLAIRPWQPGHTIILTSHGAEDDDIIRRFGHLGLHTMTKMSSSWKFCLLAEGKADLSPRLGDTSEWDTAAGHCILKEAGGDILDLQGNPLCYNTKPSLINPHFIALGDIHRLTTEAFKLIRD